VGEQAPRRQVITVGNQERKMRARQGFKLLASAAVALPLLLAGAAPSAGTVAAGPRAPMLMGKPVTQSPQAVAVLVAKLADKRAKYGLDQDHGYRLSALHPGAAGTAIARFAHTYKGVRVYQSESVVVTDNAGNVVSESVSDRRNGLGRGASAIRLGGRYANFDVTPALSPQAAVDTVVRSTAPAAAHAAQPSAELVIYPVVQRVRVQSAMYKREWQLNAMDLVGEVSGYELAYLVKTEMTNADRPLHRGAIVSASDGRIIAQWDALQTIDGVGNSQYNGQVQLSTTLSSGRFIMKDPLRGTGGPYNANAVTNADHTGNVGGVYQNRINIWGDGLDYSDGGPTYDANGQTAAVNAMWGLMNTYDMLKNVLGWSSLDGNDTATYIAVHVYNHYENAYYSTSCRCMFIGDGNTNFYNLSSVDVIAHEMGHGVTFSTSGLQYWGESGGLNESASDINGEMTEAYARGGSTGSTIPAAGNDWKIGQEISRTGNPLRWLYRPGKDGNSPDAWSSALATMDVHYSSGPNNRMFYFLSQGSSANSASDYYSPYLTRSPRAMTGIGNDKAYRIWFRALTTKFTSSTNYADARNKVLEAARELYGTNSREAIAVQRAYAAINVGSDVDEPGAAPLPLAISSQPQSATVMAGATATFSALVQGGVPPYRYQWRRNGADIAGANASTYSLAARAGDSGAGFSVLVSDSASPPSSVLSATAMLTLAPGVSAERMLNGSFESGAAAWSGDIWTIGSWAGSTQKPYDGAAFAYFGGTGRTLTQTLSQTVQIPANASSAVLSFALHIDTAEYSRMIPYDTLNVTLRNPAGLMLANLARYSNMDAPSGYQIRSIDVSAYRGQTVTVSFEVYEDFSLQTSFTVDKVSLTAR
jgi:Zn-dependent metalloprotease